MCFNKEEKHMKKLLSIVLAFIVLITAVSSCSYAFAASKALSQPTGVKVTSVSSTSVTLKWNKVKNANRYQVLYSTSQSFKNQKLVSTTKQTVTIKKLSSNKTYYFKVRATAKSKKSSKYSKAVSAKTKKKYKTTIENRINSGEWFNLESCIFPGDAIQILKFNNGSVTVKTTGNEAEVVDKHKYTVINDSSVKFTYTIKNYDTVTCTISIIDGSKLLKVKYYYKKHAETYYSLLTSEKYSGPNVTNTPIANTFYNNYWYSDYFDNKYLTFQCIVVHGIDEETAYIAVNHGGYYAYTPLISKSLASFSLQEDDIFISAIIEYVGDNNSLNAFIFEDQNEPIMEKWVLI